VKVWAALYAMVWLVLLEFLTLMLAPRGSTVAIWLHIAIGVGIVAFAFVNWKAIEVTAAPARPKRVAKALFRISAASAVLGVPLYFDVTPGLGFLRGGPVYVLHLMMAFAILTQAASIATGYDMWEEREFEAEAPAAEAAPRPEAPSTALY
jgi:hypothetical protein